MAAELAKPGIEVDLTDKSGKKITLKMSKPSGDVVYAQMSDGPAVYKLKKADFDSLNLGGIPSASIAIALELNR